MKLIDIKHTLSWVAWPFLLCLCVVITHIGFVAGHPIIGFNIAYLTLALSLFFLEKYMPHEKKWLENDHQTFANIAHTLTSKGVVQGLMIFGGVVGLSAIITSMTSDGFGLWPRDWPLIIQVIMGVTLAEFGLYWAHRLSHEYYPLWRFHAVHHSVTRLWIINTGRFHFIDSLFSIVLGVSILLILGAPIEVIIWLSAITAFIGMLTHCNVTMRFGWISYVFNTPELHRWHHSRDLREGNKNYCENIMLWDHVFGTWFNEKRRPPVDIGIAESMPPTFIAQLAWPFKGLIRKRKKKAL